MPDGSGGAGGGAAPAGAIAGSCRAAISATSSKGGEPHGLQRDHGFLRRRVGSGRQFLPEHPLSARRVGLVREPVL